MQPYRMASFNRPSTPPSNPGSGRPWMATSSPRKALFRSPAAIEDTQSADLQLDKMEVEQLTENCVKNLQKEIHEQRLNDLRKKMVWLTETDWKYKRPEELIGLEK
ncbi:uncharacterized protein LOC115921657 [Strongylocentrotus purpuratus]|uniref:Uncharacterized protein n=1 Tax=Strongylocentrotus purpuratus TaxID=7668 RepID=A0A7M7NE23_STRPU|nr:uncharacterized protein LOC105439132 [Strongylocentrotus purpuratus]XP_030835275.1 uncharacterized protein LOC115921657 [Strongylocentrotus purpuratus]|eukprot:XP_011666061.1 PREDICTED: uncharacterized protein LOC105439132 [Strongylocentrotus purpuratus]